jgi:hypothetical protein
MPAPCCFCWPGTQLKDRPLLSKTMAVCCSVPDGTEFYFVLKDKKEPLSKQVKRGLA